MTAQLFEGPTPTWVSRLDEEVLRDQLDPGTVARGSGYARDGAVTALSTSDNGRLLLASVRGSGRQSYQTLVAAEKPVTLDPDEPLDWSGRCSCPVQHDCKHVAAVLLTARARLTGGNHAAPDRWEATLAELVRDRPADQMASLALQFEVTTPKPSRYAAASPPAARLRIRPVTPGKNGGWIKTGVSWRDLEFAHGRVPVDSDQREAIMMFQAAFRVRGSSYYAYGEPQIHLDELGPTVWRLLHDAQTVGIPLVWGRGGSQVQLVDEPADLVLDVRQEEREGDVTISAKLRVPGMDDIEVVGELDPLSLIGEPAHGVFVQGRERLVLASFERPLDLPTHRLLSRGEIVTIPAADAPRFLSRYYPALRQRASVESSDGSITFPEVRPPVLRLAVRFDPGHQTLLRWSFGYWVDDELVDAPAAAPDSPASGARATNGLGPNGPARDRVAEAALLEGLLALDVLDAVPGLVARAGSAPSVIPQTRLAGIDTAMFVETVLPVLQEREDIVLDVQGTPVDYVETTEAPLISVSASDSADADRSDWFDLGIAVTLEGQEVPFAPLFTALARGEEHLILDSGTWFRLDRPELHALRHLIEEARSLQDRDTGTVRVTPWHAGLWEELVSLGVVAHQSERWARTVGALLDLKTIPQPEAPTGLLAELRPYQVDGYHWLSLLWDHHLGGVLADDMGLGKTLQTLAMASRARELGTLTPEQPLLIVAPTSVVATWAREAARFCPDLRVVTVTETEKRRGEPLLEQAVGAHLVVTSYALLRIDEDAYRAQPWSGLVLDEAQFVKNHQAKTYQVARRLPAPFKLAITGTPLENSLMDLWSLLSIVAPGLFPSPQRFTELYRKPIESGQSPELLATLRRRIRPLMLRRTKEQVAPDLPPKVEQVLSVTLNPQHQRVYQIHLQRERQRILGLIDDMQRNRIAILRSLTVLRQLSLDASLVDAAYAGRISSSKIDALMEQLEEVVAEGHRALVFSQFTGFLGLVRQRLVTEGIDHVYLDGRTRDRPRRIAEFTEGQAPVFLISLKAGGSGLTLTEADYVFILDPWWNPATEAQAVDRAHRIGQDKTVMVYRLVATDTIEEKVVELQQRKRDLFARVVEEEGMMGAPLTANDIRGLLGA